MVDAMNSNGKKRRELVICSKCAKGSYSWKEGDKFQQNYNGIYNRLPSGKEIERITRYFSNPNCKGINEGVVPNTNELDRMKYSFCQSISRYKRINNLTPNALAKKIEINKGKVDNILFGRINDFNLEELVSYTGKLNGHTEVKVEYDKEETSTRSRYVKQTL